MTDSALTSCPDCGAKGRKVERCTLESLLTSAAKQGLNGSADFRFCKNGECDVVYFGDGSESRFTTGDLSVSVYQKSEDLDRLVCYCFDHSVKSIYDEVARSGSSKVAEEIGDQCKVGLDNCETNNPQGSCCLGNVRQVVKAAMENNETPVTAKGQETLPDCSTAAVEESADDDCCAPAKSAESSAPGVGQQDRGDRAGLWSAGGALVAAVLSSACCWLPLALIGFGASAAGVASFFEEYRTLLLGVTALLLGAGFYYVYFRKPKCAPGDACAVPNPKLQRMNKITLWIATVFVVAFAAFPQYIGALLGGDDEPPPIIDVPTQTRTYDIGGMTCEGCAEHVRAAIQKLPGVASVEVSYETKTARVEVTEDAHEQAIVAAVQDLGFELKAKQLN